MYAVVLAGGEGRRLRPLTEDRPKVMINIEGWPLMFWHLQWLKHHGVDHVLILNGYKHHAIESFFQSGERDGLKITYLHEEKLLGRGGAIRRAVEFIPEDEKEIVVTNGDVLTTADLSMLIREHHKYQMPGNKAYDVTALAVQPICPYGQFLFRKAKELVPFKTVYAPVDQETNEVDFFQEKGFLQQWVNGGVYVINRSFITQFPTEGDHEKELFPLLARMGGLQAIRLPEFWMSIDTHKDLDTVRALFKSISVEMWPEIPNAKELLKQFVK